MSAPKWFQMASGAPGTHMRDGDDVKPYTRETLPTRTQLRGWLKTGVFSVAELDALHETAERLMADVKVDELEAACDIWQHPKADEMTLRDAMLSILRNFLRTRSGFQEETK